MAIVQISKIQHRTGANIDLPQLDVGEIGFATDERRLYIGNDPVLHPAANSAVTTQTEILTEHSDISFSKITGTANGNIRLANVVPGQIIVAKNIANTTNLEWTNAGGNGRQPGNVNQYANANVHLGHVNYVKLGGGTNGYVLQTDGTGNLTWAAFLQGSVVSGTPGGANAQIQYNDGGTNFGGSSGFTYDKVTGQLTNSGNIVGGNINGPLFGPLNGTVGATTPNTGAFTSIVVSNNATINGNITAGNANVNTRLNVTGNANVGNLYTTGLANVGNLRVSSRVQSSLIPSADETYDLGSSTLKWKDLYLSGTSIKLGSQTISSNLNGVVISNNLYVGNTINSNNFTANRLTGTLVTANQPNITALGTLSSLNVNGVANLGNVANIRISGGFNGYVLTSNGAGGVSWQAAGGSGAGIPGGANTQLQFNDDGSFAGNSTLTFDKINDVLSVSNVNVSSVLNVANVGNIRVPGGVSGQFLRTNGSGVLSWATPSGGGSVGGSNTQIQFNDSGSFGGSVNLVFFKTTNTLQVPNLDATLVTSAQPNITSVGNLTSLRVVGNTTTGNITSLGNATANLFIGSGASLTNINGANVSEVPNANFATQTATANFANFAGNVTVAAQANITSLGTLTGLTVNGISTLGNVGNVRIAGGSNGQVLSTNGASGLNWVSMQNPDSNANSVQFNNNGVFGGTSTFTFDSSTNTLSVTNITGVLTTAANAQPNITSVGNLSSLNVVGNITAGNANLGALVTASEFSGGGGNLSNIAGANVVGEVSNANYSSYALDVTNAAQPNITSVGTLTGLDVSGDANITGNITVDIVTANYIYGDGSNITAIDGTSVTGIVANANMSSYTNYVIDPTQANITSVGNLVSLTIKTTAGNDEDALTIEGSVTNLYFSTNSLGFAITNRPSEGGAGFFTIDGLISSIPINGSGLSAPNLISSTNSDAILLAKNDSTLANAHSVVPLSDFTTNMGGTDEALGEVYFRNMYAASYNIKDTSGAPATWPTATTWQLLAGPDGLYFTDGFSMFKVNATDVSADVGNGTVPNPVGPDPA